MDKAIVTAIASLLSLAAAFKIDAVLGKWVGYFTIAWRTKASEAARAATREIFARLRPELAAGYASREEWRRRARARADQGGAQ
jgi:hypothetical protein